MMRWLLTYADMITLMLALFIILFSISTINKVKLQRLVRDLGGGFNSQDAINNPPNGMTTSATKDDLQAMQAQLQSYVSANQLQNKVQTKIQREGKKRELVITPAERQAALRQRQSGPQARDQAHPRPSVQAAEGPAERSARRGQHRQRTDLERAVPEQLGALVGPRDRRRAVFRRKRRTRRRAAFRRSATANTGPEWPTTPTPTGRRTGASTS